PENVLFDAPSSEGKTTIITSVLSIFPEKYVTILRDASPKSFTHERGELALRVINEKGDKEYITRISNRFEDGEEVSVAYYKSYLENKYKMLQIQARKDKSKMAELRAVREEIESMNKNLVTLIEFSGTVIAFLDQPREELLRNLLSVMSHDAPYIETAFAEGEGYITTKHVVFKGWPAFIFAVSKDSFLNWADIQTRFEVREPVMAPEKYEAAINLRLKEMYGVIEQDNGELQVLREEIAKLITRVKDDFSAFKVQFILPMNPDDVLKSLFPHGFQHGDSMRKIPRILAHWRASCLWNYENRVKLMKDRTLYVVISADDLRSITSIYDDLELNSILSGMPSTLYEFHSRVLAPMFQLGEDDEYEPVRQSDILKKLEEYCKTNKTTKLRPDKRVVSRLLTQLEKRGMIRKIPNEDDKRGQKIITLVDPEEFVTSIDTKIEELIRKISPLSENGSATIIRSLLNENYTAFFNNKKIVHEKVGAYTNNENVEVVVSREPQKIEEIEKDILTLSGYGSSISPSCETNFETNSNRYFVSELYDKTIPFYYTGTERISIKIAQGSDDILGIYNVDLAPEDIFTVPLSIGKQLADQKLGKLLMADQQPKEVSA
ncbi:MAG: hypothetical protein QW292_14510, partial [Candidatus Parvarchaeota archaeon]